MTVESDLRTFLLGDATVAGIVGTRIYPLFIPATGTIPAVVLQRIVTERIYAHDGESGLQRPRIQVSCWASSPDAAWALAAAVIDRLRENGEHVTVVNEIHDGEPKEETQLPTDRFRVLLDVAIQHVATVS